MFVIKHIPEDFKVKEKSTVKIENKGKYTYFELKKKNWNTINALKKIAKTLNTKLAWIGFAGNKDKKAITTQVCSIKKHIKKNMQFDGFEIRILGYGNEPVHLGNLKGNEFEITVRNIEKKPKINKKFVNYYGEQRFGTNNAETGKAIVKRNFKKAAELLKIKGTNYISELRKIPKKQLVFYVHAYQSKLWNKAAEQAKNLKELPIIGFGTEKIDKYTKKILEQEKIKPRDFIIKELPEASSEGGTRKIHAKAENLKIGKLEEDEYFQGKKKITLKFFLAKGSYATEFIKQNFHQQ
ncbi:hypothetical protein DRJ22_00175 [Candidatus Woesearchaeota archaeon]|nr:MAG: hypothetical protein DRJ22_00175 [Candidatus Woesearchaeota archaeon]